MRSIVLEMFATVISGAVELIEDQFSNQSAIFKLQMRAPI